MESMVETPLTQTHPTRATGDRRTRMARTIVQLIDRRREVLVAYCELAGLENYDVAANVNPQLRRFCQLMVDYTALGHFEIYQRIIEGNERRVKVRETAERVYPALAETTDLLVDFNDKYDVLDDRDSLEYLPQDLSGLGEAFAVRIELEDQILGALGDPMRTVA